MGGCRDGLEGGMGPKQAFSGGVPAVSEAEGGARTGTGVARGGGEERAMNYYGAVPYKWGIPLFFMA